jgi:molybdate/tungstate transport system permease protein
VALADGANTLQAFWYVTLPLARRGILAGGALMMWARGISEFGAVVILAYHPKVMTVLLYERFQGFGLAAALPLTALLVLIAVFVIGLLRWIIRAEPAL